MQAGILSVMFTAIVKVTCGVSIT